MSNLAFTFLIASERSGGNLIASLMNAHSAICAPPPSHLFRLFASNAANYGDLGRDENWSLLLREVIAAFEAQLGSWNTAPTLEGLRSAAIRRNMAEPLRAIYEAEARRDGARHVFVKENQTARFAAFLLAHFRPCRFVFLVRDPRDVAASYLSTDGIPGGVARAVEVWREDQEANRRLLEQLHGSGLVHSLRYEDLLADPRAELAGLMKFLDLEFEPAMLGFHRDGRVRRNAERIAAWGNLARPLLAGNAGKFASQLTAAEIEYVELCCFELMRPFGYAGRIITDVPGEEDRARIDWLRPTLREGRYRLRSDEEREVRQRRLEMIETVKTRRPASSALPGSSEEGAGS